METWGQHAKYRWRRGRLARLVASAVGVATVTLFGSGVSYGAAAPSPTPVQQTDAIIKPSVVFIQTEWTGFVMTGPLATFLEEAYGPGTPKITATITGSGYIASPDGHIITAGHVVDNQTVQYGGKGVIIESAVAQLEKDGYLQDWDVNPQTLLTNAIANSTVEGSEAGSPPDRTVSVFRTQAASGVAVTNGLAANVVDFKPFPDGDVALLKVDNAGKSPMPALQVAPAAPEDGTPVVAAGYPGSVNESVDMKVSEPTLNPGSVGSTQTVNGVPFTGISAPTSPGMSGGPVVDSQGQVVGTVSWTPGQEQQSINFMTHTSAVKDMLAAHGVANTLSSTDQAYRAGLAAYFAGKYHQAKADFDKVLALEPDHAQAQNYRRLAITNFPNEKQAGSNTLLFVGIGVGALILLAGGTTFVVLRRRRARRPVTEAPIAAPLITATPGPRLDAPTGTGTGGAEPVVTPSAVAEGHPPVPDGDGTGEPASTRTHAGAFCPNCGEPHTSEAHFCASCGKHFEEVLNQTS